MSSSRPSAGEIVDGKYEIGAQIGRGGMAFVYEATHRQLGTLVALKVLRPEYAASATFVGRFSREARAAARLQSEHVALVLDVGTLPSGAPYMVMERLNGHDLRHELEARGPLPVELVVDWVLQTCDAVAEAHARGIIHRDLKPSNLFVARRDDGSARIKVLDFGIAKSAGGVDEAALTATQEVFGSPAYMSPEQLRASSLVDARSDVWALGVVMWELLCGVTPFRGAVAEVHTAVLAGMVPQMQRDDVPVELRQVVDRCLQKDPERRFPNIAALAHALRPFAPADAERRVQAIEAWSSSFEKEGHVTVRHGARYEDTKHTATAPPPPIATVEPVPASRPSQPAQQTNTNWDQELEKRRAHRRWGVFALAAVASFVSVTALLLPRDEPHHARAAIAPALQPALLHRPVAQIEPPIATVQPTAAPVMPATSSATPKPKAKPLTGPKQSIYDDRE